MSVDDFGLEVLKKSGLDVSHDKTNYAIQTTQVGGFAPSFSFDAITCEYPSSTEEIYRYRTGGVSGSIVMSLTVDYTSLQKTVSYQWCAHEFEVQPIHWDF